MGKSYSVTLVTGALEYRSLSHGYEDAGMELVSPSEERWVAFRGALDRLRVWEWHPNYYVPVLDGTAWNLVIHIGDQKVESNGSNAYPGDAPGTSSEVHMSRRFTDFCAAVSMLLGGLPFE